MKETKGSGAGNAQNSGLLRKGLTLTIITLVIIALLLAFSVPSFIAARNEEVIVKGPGVTSVGRLSDYFDGISGTTGDTDVYFIDSKQPGATVVIFGGVHSNEPAGSLAAIMLIENAVVEKGRLIIIPHANSSGLRYTASREATPLSYTIKTKWGERVFKYGDRLTSPLDQYPDPDVYVHYPSGQLQSGNEVRNLDRAFPGKPDGMLTEKIAYAITQIVKKENAGLVIDLHEARPMNPIVNCIIAHEKARNIATIAMLDLELFEKINIGLEPSPKNMHGLSHREIGDHTQALSVLMETANPGMDWLRGPTTEKLIVEGFDPFYVEAAANRLLYVPFPATGIPLSERVGRHLSGVQALLRAYTEIYPDTPIVAGSIPVFADLKEKGIGEYLLKP